MLSFERLTANKTKVSHVLPALVEYSGVGKLEGTFRPSVESGTSFKIDEDCIESYKGDGGADAIKLKKNTNKIDLDVCIIQI